MWTYKYNNLELYHHGVKGQRWGVRRYQNPDGTLTPAGKKRVSNKQVRKEMKQVREDEEKRLLEKYGYNKKMEASIAFGEKHGLDLDDGGGGDEKAGRQYWKQQVEIDRIYQKAQTQAGKKAAKYVVDKYGQEKLDSIKRADKARNIAVYATLPFWIATAPITVPATIIASTISANKKNKQQERRNTN